MNKVYIVINKPPKSNLKKDLEVVDVVVLQMQGADENESVIFDRQHVAAVSGVIEQIVEVSTNRVRLEIEIGEKVRQIDNHLYAILIGFAAKQVKIEFIIRISNVNGRRFALSNLANYYLNYFKSQTNIVPFQVIIGNSYWRSTSRIQNKSLPILLVNETSFDHLFIDSKFPIDYIEYLRKINLDELYEEFVIYISTLNKKEVLRTFKTDFNKLHRRIVLDKFDETSHPIYYKTYLLHYIDMLCHLGVATYMMFGLNKYQNLLKLLTFQNIKNGVNFDYLERLKTEVTKLRSQSIFFILIYSLLVQKTIDPDKLSSRLLFIRCESIFNFARTLSAAIKEIARNAVDHTPDKFGVLLTDIISGKFAINSNAIELDLKADLYSADSFLQISVFDFGTEGIIETLRKRLQFEASVENVHAAALIQEDLTAINRQGFCLSDLFSYQDNSLNYLNIKTSAHLGLYVFSSIVKRIKGEVIVSSRVNSTQLGFDSCKINTFATETIANVNERFGGTQFQVLIPIDLESPIVEFSVGGNRPLGGSNKNQGSLLNYQVQSINEEVDFANSKLVLIIPIRNYQIESKSKGYHFELEVARTISDELIDFISSDNSLIIALDFDTVESFFSVGSIYRLIGYLQTIIDIKSLIVYNIDFDFLKAILSTIYSLAENKTAEYWADDHFILFYCYQQDGRFRYYFSDIIGGKSVDIWESLRRSIPGIVGHNLSRKKINEFVTIKNVDSLLFIDNTVHLKAFDQVLTYRNRPLHNYNVEYLLNKNYSTIQQTDVNYIAETLHGYRVSNSHFKLNGGLHLDDFIYAKKLFQLSFFVNKFALQIADFIVKSQATKVYNFVKEKGLTIVGFGDYSSFLLNRVCAILSERAILSKLNLNSVNYDIIASLDSRETELGSSFNENIIIITPIASTLQTASNLYSKILQIHAIRNSASAQKKQAKNINILQPFISIIVVGHGDLTNEVYVEKVNYILKKEKSKVTVDDRKEIPYLEYNWKYIDINSGIAYFESNNPDHNIEIDEVFSCKYFITISSKWHIPYFCELCYPPKHLIDLGEKSNYFLLREAPLIVTDKSSVTPELLIEFPSGFMINQASRERVKLVSFDGCYKKGHFIHRGQDFLHYIDAHSFYSANYSKISIWGGAVKKSLSMHYNLDGFENLILVTPSDRENAYFVEFVNKVIFNDIGQILRYDLEADHFENYQKYFKDILTEESIVFFVDDFIRSGDTFKKINEFIGYCNYEISQVELGNQNQIKINHIITLIDRTDAYTKKNILSSIGLSSLGAAAEKVYSFVELYLYNINSKNCPVCKLISKFTSLANDSVLDSVKHYFLDKVNGLCGVDSRRVREDDASGWYNYHPLLLEEFADPLGYGKEINSLHTEIFEVYCSGKWPNKHYLKLLVEHEINYFLSSADYAELKSVLIFSKGVDDDIDNVFNKIIGLILSSGTISKVRERLPRRTAQILDELVEDIVIKIISSEPYISIIAVRKKIFKWLLKLTIDRFEIISDKVNRKRYKFRHFRKLKLLLSRLSSLRSNFIISAEIYEYLNKIYSAYTIEIKDNYDIKREVKLKIIYQRLNSISVEMDSLIEIINKSAVYNGGLVLSLGYDIATQKERLSALVSEKNYLEQCVRNIRYINKTINEFSIYFAALTKEVVFQDSVKSQKLELAINSIIKTRPSKLSIDFEYLLKLILYENSLGLINFSSVLTNRENNTNSDKYDVLLSSFNSGFEVELKSYKSYINYFINSGYVFSFDGEVNSDFSNDDLIVTYIAYSLFRILNDEVNNADYKTDKTLVHRTKLILKSLQTITYLENMEGFDLEYSLNRLLSECGCLLVIKTGAPNGNLIRPENLFLAEYTNKQDEPILDLEFDDRSISYYMINGLSQPASDTDGFTKWPRSILHFMKTETGFKPNLTKLSVSANLVGGDLTMLLDKFNELCKDNIIDQYFTENVYVSTDVMSFTTVRLSNIGLVGNSVRDSGIGVINFYSTSNEAPKFYRLRWLIVLRSLLVKYIMKHYGNDTVSSFIEERNRTREYQKMQHGFKKYLGDLTSVMIGMTDDNKRKDYLELLYTVIRNGSVTFDGVENQVGLNKNNSISDVRDLLKNSYEDFRFVKTTTSGLVEKIKRTVLITIENKISTTNPILLDNSQIHIKNNVDNLMDFYYSEAYFTSILVEILINVKRHGNAARIHDFNISMEVDPEEPTILWISVANISKSKVNKKILKRLNSHSYVNSRKGYSLIKRLCVLLTGHYPKFIANNETNLFVINVPIKMISP